MATYRVEVNVGGYSWTVTDDDPPTYGLMDPLTISWTNPEPVQRPGQPDPMVATVALIVPSAADLANLRQGDLTTIKVTFMPPKDTCDVFFVGRVAQADAAPHPRGMLYRLTCSDLTVDLAGYTIGVTPYSPQWANDRQAAMLVAAGLADTDLRRDPVVVAPNNTAVLDHLDPQAAQLLQATIDLWDQIGLNALAELAGTVFYRAIVAPYPGAGSLGPTVPWRWALDAVPDAYIPTVLTPLPGVFGHFFPEPKAWGVGIDPDQRDAGVFDACFVDWEVSWAAVAPAVVHRAVVTWATTPDYNPDVDRIPQVTTVDENPAPAGMVPVTATRQTETIGMTGDPATVTAAQDNAVRLGRLMVPPPANPAGWAPDTFRWLLYADQAGLEEFPVIFPRHDATGQPTPAHLRTAAYVRPVVIEPVPLPDNVAGPTRNWVAGQLTTVELTIADGRPVVDMTLAPVIPPPGNPNTSANSWDMQTGTWDAQVGTWDDLIPGIAAFRWDDRVLAAGTAANPVPGGVTWDQLEPTQSWQLYQLARGN